jgi:hypothetical protein
MKRLLLLGAAAAALTGTALPALAHITTGPAPHTHPGDTWGLLAVAGLTVVAAWLGRRRP